MTLHYISNIDNNHTVENYLSYNKLYIVDHKLYIK